MTINIVCLLTVFISGATLGESPFNVIQLLWINMIMDTLAAIMLATEPPKRGELKKTRIRKTDPIIVKAMWRNVLGVALYQFIVMMVLLYAGPYMYGRKYDYYQDTAFYIKV